MQKRIKDIERMADTVGINLNSHLNFGVSKPPTTLTPVITQQEPADVIDNVEKKV